MTHTDAPEPTPDGFCVCNGPAANGRMRDCGIAAHRAEAGAPEPTPAVEQFFTALDAEARRMAEAVSRDATAAVARAAARFTVHGVPASAAVDAARDALSAALDVEEMARELFVNDSGQAREFALQVWSGSRDDSPVKRLFRDHATALRTHLLGSAS